MSEAVAVPKWSEGLIGNALARQTFKKGVLIVPNTQWTGHEADLLVLTEQLLLVDVEVKISRADFKADASKNKWWELYEERIAPQGYRFYERRAEPGQRTWPPKVWKHYYAIPAEVWRDDLLAAAASPASGVITLKFGRGYVSGQPVVEASVARRAKPNPDAAALSARQVQDLARLAGLRMWDALRQRGVA